MIIFAGGSTNLIYYNAIKTCLDSSSPVTESRAGRVRSIGPACFELPDDDRLIVLNGRAINPFFAVIEAAWVLSGRNDIQPLCFGIKDYIQYSDDGVTINGAYGYRLRHEFGLDQIDAAIEVLSKQLDSRRVVLTMFSPGDLGKDSNDIPCNTHLYLKVVNGALDVTVSNRSNDIFKGVPYNFFVFRILQQFLAKKLGLPCGVQRHITDCLHLYEENFSSAVDIVNSNSPSGIYKNKNLKSSIYDDIYCNYKEIASLNFKSIREPYRSVFNLFVNVRSMSTVPSSISTYVDFGHDSFVYSAMNWFLKTGKLKDCPFGDDFKGIQENFAMKSNYDLIKGLWAVDSDNGIRLLNEIIRNCTPCFKQILDKSNISITIDVGRLPLEKQAAFIILSLAMSSIDPNVVSTSFGRDRQRKLLVLAEKIGLPRTLCIVSEATVEDVVMIIDDCSVNRQMH